MNFDATELRTIHDRYEAHIDDIEGRAGQSGRFALRSGQIGLARDFISFLGEPSDDGKVKNSGYFVRPTGTGKTVSLIDFIIGANTLPGGRFVLGDSERQKRTLVMVPQNFLLDQWENELLGEPKADGGRQPSKWGDLIKNRHVGIYRATDSFEKKCEALEKPVVVMTYDSARIITTGENDPNIKEESGERRAKLKKLLNPKHFPITLLDEVHDRPRGDMTGAFIKDHFFGKSLVIGATATHLYKSGKTIGDYLFDGQIPFHETTFHEAVNNGEICPMRNIIAEVMLQPEQERELRKITEEALTRALAKGAHPRELDYTQRELERIVEITKRDEAAIRLLQRGFDPDTGKRYRDMKQVWYCASVKHAQHLAEKLNEAMGSKDYAMAVHGQMDGVVQDAILINYKRGQHKALTNCQLLTLGFDDPQAELCLQLVPTRSPTRSMQQGGRVMRLDRNNPHKIANIITFVYPGIDQVVFGELAQGSIMIPQGYEFPRTDGGVGTVLSGRAWPEIEGLKVSYTTEQLQLFAEKRARKRYVNGLPGKSDDMLTVEEMARTLFPQTSGTQLSHETARLQRRVYEPLQAAFDMRQQRQQFVGLSNAETDTSESISAFGQRFPAWRIGHCNYQNQDRFCIDKALAAMCRHSMYGRVNVRTPDLLSETMARKLSGLSDGVWYETINRVKESYLDRKAYDRALQLDGITLPHEMIGYYRNNHSLPNQAQVDFCLTPDALLPIYRMATKATADMAKKWWDEHPQLPKLKTSDWLRRESAKEMLGISPLDSKNEAFEKLWDTIERNHKSVGGKAVLGEEKEITLTHIPGVKIGFNTARKRTLSDGQDPICIRKDELSKLRFALGMESDYEAAKREPKVRRFK